MTPRTARKDPDQYGFALLWGHTNETQRSDNELVIRFPGGKSVNGEVTRLSETRHEISYRDRVVEALSKLEQHYQSLIDNPELTRDVAKNRENLRRVTGIRRVDINQDDTKVSAVAFPNGIMLSIGYTAAWRISYKNLSPETEYTLLEQPTYETILEKYIPGNDYPEKLQNLWEILDCRSDEQAEQIIDPDDQNPARSIQFWLKKRQIVPGISEHKSLSMGRGRDGVVTAYIRDTHPETKAFMLRTVSLGPTSQA